MTRMHLSRILPICGLLMMALVGCGGKQDSSETAPGAAKSPDQAVQNRMSDPHISDTEKAEIRKHMTPEGQSGGQGGPK